MDLYVFDILSPRLVHVLILCEQEVAMGRMVMAYRQKVERIARSQVAMATKGMLRTLQAKMVKIMERDEVTRELFLIPDMRVSEKFI